MKQLSDFASQILDFHVLNEEQKHQILSNPELYETDAQALDPFVKRIEKALENKEKVFVFGDYDTDGVLGTAIMVSGLTRKGLQTGYYIPNRIHDGYGIDAKWIETIKEKGYSLIITVDNGISAFDAVNKAHELGLGIIVTDHHTITKKCPADVIVHPAFMKQPFSTLCGAGVAYECIRALNEDTIEHLQYAAIASIADCMDVFGQTRMIIAKGMESLNEKGEIHLNALFPTETWNEENAAYQIIPRINAPGRLPEKKAPHTLVTYFLNPKPQVIYNYAAQVNEVNSMRRMLSDQIYSKALALIKPYHNVLLLKDDSFHEGVIGLGAGQLCEHFKKPVILAAKGVSAWKGSMRSPKGFSCIGFLSKYDGFTACGGHEQAAGFSLPFDRWDEFEAFVSKMQKESAFEPEQDERMLIRETDITIENIESLDLLRPFGNGFELPEFTVENPMITSQYDLSMGKHRKYMLSNGASAIHFNQSPGDMRKSVLDIKSISGTLSINVYQGRRSPQMIITHIEYR